MQGKFVTNFEQKMELLTGLKNCVSLGKIRFMKIHFVSLIFITFLFPLSILAQDQANMMNGKILQGKIDSIGEYQIKMRVNGKKGKVYDSYLENYRVFSVVTSDGKETILYKQDTSLGNLLAPADMKFLIAGEQDAYKNYKPIGTMILGAGLGIGISLYDTYSFSADTTTGLQKGFFHAEPGFVHLVYPLVFTIGSGLVRTQLDINNVSDKMNLNSEHYIEGFARTARFKRTVRALISSFTGCLIGVGVYGIAQAFR